ncbi:hypothetical protein C8R46DRAFT_912346, partial [Mycena filopes]
MFASVYDVFEKESELMGGSSRDKDNARHLMRKMVNSMSAKMEIGSPMASLYLLGNPDHYSSHDYVPFAWRQYVQFVRSFWVETMAQAEEEEEEEEEEDEEGMGLGADNQEFGGDEDEKLPIGRMDGKFVPASSVDDYRYRPLEYESLTLYEWIQCYKKKKRSDAIDKAKAPAQYPFLPAHPLFRSHSVSCNHDNVTRVIPNFIGGAVPRSDKGDLAGYYMTMLTLLKPWRTPADLKDEISTWAQAFKEHTFTPRQRQLIKNFDVRYECNDARDDHFAQMKKKLAEAKKDGKTLWPAGFMPLKDKFSEDLNDFDYGSDDDALEDRDEDSPKGRRTMQLLAEAKDMRNIMQASGWLDRSTDGLPSMDADFLMVDEKPRLEWVNIVKHQRLELTANKMANVPPAPNGSKPGAGRFITSLLSFDYYNHRSTIDARKNADIVSSVLMSFDLNAEQTRAFKIVTEHASSPQPLPLRMYLGGMGGTGKSQVLKAIISFFDKRGESYRYMVLGPTGSTAALLNGSTYHSVFKI